MWNYEKRLQFPVNIKEPNAKLATVIMSQYGGPDGEMGASMRYLSQRYAMPYKEVAGLLTDIGTEELAHVCWKYNFFIFLKQNGFLNTHIYNEGKSPAGFLRYTLSVYFNEIHPAPDFNFPQPFCSAVMV